MRVMEFVVPVLNSVLRLPGLARALERFGGDLGKGIVLGYRWKQTILRMNRSGVVYVAAINGPALDGGLEIALACDLRYAADAAHLRMSQSEMLVGTIPGGGSQRLLRMLGTARARAHPRRGSANWARGARTRAGSSGRVRAAAPRRGTGNRRSPGAPVTGRRRGAQAMPLLRDGSQLQPRPRPRTRRVRSGWINAGRAPCPAALPRGLGASRRYAIPLRSEAVDR